MAKSPPSEAITYNDRSVLESFHAADPRRSRFRFRQARKKDQIHHPMIMCIYIYLHDNIICMMHYLKLSMFFPRTKYFTAAHQVEVCIQPANPGQDGRKNPAQTVHIEPGSHQSKHSDPQRSSAEEGSLWRCPRSIRGFINGSSRQLRSQQEADPKQRLRHGQPYAKEKEVIAAN